MNLQHSQQAGRRVLYKQCQSTRCQEAHGTSQPMHATRLDNSRAASWIEQTGPGGRSAWLDRTLGRSALQGGTGGEDGLRRVVDGQRLNGVVCAVAACDHEPLCLDRSRRAAR
jgi:hypothetical protein